VYEDLMKLKWAVRNGVEFDLKLAVSSKYKS